MSTNLDQIMERASKALSRMDYLACEADCLEALRLARDACDWAFYCRVLLPLQESRRQRRIIAADGIIRLGTTDLRPPAAAWLTRIQIGCIVVTHPYRPDDANALMNAARAARLHLEVLFADNLATAPTWELRNHDGPDVRCQVPAPPPSLVERWLEQPPCPGSTGTQGSDMAKLKNAPDTQQPAEWFLNVTEQLGDAALAQIDPQTAALQRIESLEQRLAVVTDHEILHQRLWDAARVLCVTD